MPAIGPQPHFDVEALLEAVHQQRLGLRIDTNNPEGFKRIVYEGAAARTDRPIHIYAVPGRPNAFFLLAKPLESADATE